MDCQETGKHPNGEENMGEIMIICLWVSRWLRKSSRAT